MFGFHEDKLNDPRFTIYIVNAGSERKYKITKTGGLGPGDPHLLHFAHDDPISVEGHLDHKHYPTIQEILEDMHVSEKPKLCESIQSNEHVTSSSSRTVLFRAAMQNNRNEELCNITLKRDLLRPTYTINPLGIRFTEAQTQYDSVKITTQNVTQGAKSPLVGHCDATCGLLSGNFEIHIAGQLIAKGQLPDNLDWRTTTHSMEDDLDHEQPRIDTFQVEILKDTNIAIVGLASAFCDVDGPS